MKTTAGAHLIHVFDTTDALADAFAHAQIALAQRHIAERGLFTLALTGGGAPGPLYARLADPEFRDALDWSRVKVFWGDERPVGPDSPNSNFKLAWDAWLAKSPIPPTNIFRMKGELADLARAAEAYSEILNHEVPSGPSGFPSLDLIHLGLGENGHIASLFPDTEALNETLRLVVANDIPELDSYRLTMTYPMINAAQEIWFLVRGEAKAHRVAQVLGVLPGGETLPATMVHPAGGKVHWWLDRPAASLLPEERLRGQ